MKNNKESWRIERTKDRIDKPNGGLEIYAVDGGQVCALNGTPTKRIEAHAQLIAAAPDMLKALELTLKQLLEQQNGQVITRTVLNSLVSLLESKINKAKGE